MQPQTPKPIRMEYRPSAEEYAELLAIWREYHPAEQHDPSNHKLIAWHLVHSVAYFRALRAQPAPGSIPVAAVAQPALPHWEPPRLGHIHHRQHEPAAHEEPPLSAEETGEFRQSAPLLRALRELLSGQTRFAFA